MLGKQGGNEKKLSNSRLEIGKFTSLNHNNMNKLFCYQDQIL